ncbi:hypothetical protein [Oceanobacillus timonensis]|uniref:hypothetical protein n=1 Tax=Oceanobacillus timonensis TaxID=1926285 RepID=UPI0009BB1CBF|nr:hypothetical protein [Oceanobacillus timonensis]
MQKIFSFPLYENDLSANASYINSESTNSTIAQLMKHLATVSKMKGHDVSSLMNPRQDLSNYRSGLFTELSSCFIKQLPTLTDRKVLSW